MRHRLDFTGRLEDLRVTIAPHVVFVDRDGRVGSYDMTRRAKRYEDDPELAELLTDPPGGEGGGA